MWIIARMERREQDNPAEYNSPWTCQQGNKSIEFKNTFIPNL